jgi:hypothetical protein
VAAHQAVHDELARLQAPGDSDAGVPSPTQASAGRHGHAAQNRNGLSERARGDRACVARAATPGQSDHCDRSPAEYRPAGPPSPGV